LFIRVRPFGLAKSAGFLYFSGCHRRQAMTNSLARRFRIVWAAGRWVLGHAWLPLDKLGEDFARPTGPSPMRPSSGVALGYPVAADVGWLTSVPNSSFDPIVNLRLKPSH
jgi:hypothetical protein